MVILLRCDNRSVHLTLTSLHDFPEVPRGHAKRMRLWLAGALHVKARLDVLARPGWLAPDWLKPSMTDFTSSLPTACADFSVLQVSFAATVLYYYISFGSLLVFSLIFTSRWLQVCHQLSFLRLLRRRYRLVHSNCKPDMPSAPGHRISRRILERPRRKL